LETINFDDGNQKSTFDQAIRLCAELDPLAHLVSIESQLETALLLENLATIISGDRSFSLWTSGSAEGGAASDWFWNNTTPEPFQYTNWCAFQPLNGSWSPYRAIFTRTGCWNNGYDAESYRVLCETDFDPSVPGKKNKAALPAMDRHFVEFEGLSMCRHSLFTWWNSCVHPLFPYKIETGFDRLI